MRSVPAGSFDRLSSFGALWAAWSACRRGKRRQPAMARFDLDADRHLCLLRRELVAGTYVPSPYRLQVIRDPKTRLVAAPAIRDRVVQTALLAEIAPTYERGFLPCSYACCQGRGPHRAILAFLAWNRRRRFRLALDIRRYFASVHHETLLGLYAHRLRDHRTLTLLRLLIESGGAVYRSKLAVQILDLENDPLPPGCGLPLGGYLSHWSGGLYLDGLDHYVKRELKIPGYLRYMDDLTLFGDDPIALGEAQVAIREWLRAERRLELKRGGGIVEPTTSPATFLGVRVSRAGVLPGPKAKRRLKETLQQADSLGVERLARSLGSYRGLLSTL